MLIDRGCVMCGDIQELWPAGKRLLEQLFEGESDALPCEVWRCPTCGFVGLHVNPPEQEEDGSYSFVLLPPDAGHC